MKKRFLAMLLAVLMIVNIVPTGVIAEETDAPDEITYGSYNEEGTWVPTGESSVTENGITLSKNAVRKSENTYEVTLQVETSTTTSTVAAKAATVLVIDVSGSMDFCAECGAENHCEHCTRTGMHWTCSRTSRMAAAKTAAISFLDSYCDAPANSGRYVSVVKFSTNGSVAQNWIDVSGGKDGNANYNTVVGVINGLSAYGGTNLDDGLYNANNQFSSSTVSSIKNKFTIALTDGAPTYARGNIGDGSNGSETINSATAATAATLRGNSKVYTVCFGVADDYTYESWGGSKGPTVGNFLADSVATSGCAYNADNASELYAVFANITEDITSGLALSGSNVTDPMGGVVGTLEVSNVDKMTDGLGFTWTLGDAEITDSVDEAGNRVKTYVYTKTYTVTLNDSEVNNYNGYYPLNKSTTLTLEDGTVLQFPIPAVSPRYTVIYDNGDYGTLTGENADGQIVHDNLVRYVGTPTAPAVVPNDNYYFTGWNKTIADKVTESVTYTAQYAPKTAVTITGASGTKTYNGSEQSVDIFNYEGLPQGYTLSNVTYKAARTEVGTSNGIFTGAPVIKDAGGNDVTHQFKITQVVGTMTITPLAVNVTIVGNTGSLVYNGAEQSVTGYVATDDSSLYAETDFTFSGDATAKGTNVGTYPMGLAASQFENTNPNFTVTFTVTDGSLEITKKTVTLTSENANKVYDGTPLKHAVVKAVGFVNDKEGADYSNFAEITNVGSTQNTFQYELKDGTLAENYDISVSYGTLTVNADTDATISITPYTGIYDGKDHDALTSVVLKNGKGDQISKDDWTITYVVDGKEYTEMPSIKDVGTLPVTVKAYNSNYEALEDTATAEVTPKAVTMTSASAQKEYDGTVLTAESVEAVGFVEGEGAAYSEFASILDLGKVDNTFTYTLNSNTKAANYTIEVNYGTLEIIPNPSPITITADSNAKVYDGTALTDNGYTFTQGILKNGDVLTAVVEGTITDVGTAANVVTSYKVMRGETDVTANYTFAESVNGTLTVTERPVTLTSANASKVYDGTALTDSDVKANGFVDGEGASYSNFASITNVGSVQNTFEYALNSNTKEGNYTIEVKYGTLTVTPLPGVVVTITENSGTKVYNGAEQEISGCTVTSISNSLYKASDFTCSGDATAKGTNVGFYDMELKPEDFTNINPNFADVTFVIVDGQLEITPLPGVVVSIKENNGEFGYDGTEKTVEGYKVTKISSELYTEADFKFNGEAIAKGIQVGKYDMGVTAAMFENTNKNFKDVIFIIEDGQLTITPITTEIEITADSDSKMYDGTALTDDGYTYNEEVLANGDVLTAVVEGTITNVGKADNKVTSYVIKNSKGEDVTHCYAKAKTVNGTLSVTQRNVTLTSATDSKTYDGTPLTNDTVTVSGDGFVVGEGATYDVTGSRTTVGTSSNTFTYELNDNTLAGNYNITVVEGTLNVSPVDVVKVTITEHNGNYTYDGTEKTVTGYDVSITNDLYTVNDFNFSGQDSVSGTYAGTYHMELKAADFKNTNENFKEVIFEIVDGTLVIDPIQTEIVITADSNKKVYDGTALTDDGYTFTQGVLVEGDELTAVVEGTITDVGTVDNEVTSYVIKNSKGKDVTDCYAKAKTVDGALIVTKRPVTLTSATDSKTYDGTALTNDTVTVSEAGFAEGEGATYNVTGSQTVAGSSENTFTYSLNEGTKADNYNITTVEGILTVSPFADEIIVTITEHSGKYTYDGTEKTVTGYDVSITNELYTVNDFIFSGKGKDSVSGTYAGTYPMELTDKDFENVSTNFSNVKFVIVDGALVIEPITAEIVITAASDTKVYDGTALTAVDYTYTEAVLKNGDVLTAIVEGTITNAGTVENKVVDHKIMRGEKDVTDCYTNVTYVSGTLTVTKRPVTLTSATDSKTYDGTPLTNETVTVTGDGFVEGEGATYDVTGSQTLAGSSKNTFTYKLNDNTLADNYDITTIEGTLTVAKKGEIVVTITENSGVYTYDGTEKAVKGYTVSISDPLYTEEDFEFEGEALVTGTYVGEYDMELTPENFININENFENVTFVIVDGTLVIKPIETVIDITADSNEKIYDGTALTDDGYTFTENVLVEGDELVVVVEGTITDAGTVENKVVSYQVLRTAVEQRASVDVTDCYTFGEITDGTLTVKPREVVITSGSDTKVYDGTPLTNCDIAAEGFVKGEGAMVTFTGSQLNAGISENTFTFVFAENTKAQNYTVIVVNGKLEVTPKAVTITSGSANKHYDGEPLTCDQITAEGFVEGEGAEYDITGSQTEVGTGKNTFTYKMKDNTLAENYTVTLVEGDLLVLPPIEIPNTGDNTNLVLYAGMMVASAAAFVTLLVAGKKKGKFTA